VWGGGGGGLGWCGVLIHDWTSYAIYCFPHLDMSTKTHRISSSCQADMISMGLFSWQDTQMYSQTCSINNGFYGPNPQSGVPAWGCYNGCSSNCCIMNQPAITSAPYAFLALQVATWGMCEDV